ncbi:hypothetical protein [Ruficoccus sp. ZRK36]|uniref:hypothetical protein n=1 Tax=Ruficoccus sp. ZRK36 TaxID=2866311 RepID=UPI001C73243A|nr:hypothetical protein [Ruficoccus sp. ZRK36]QYY37306.1 hypothetical protein K0V07_07425 [Ruficoccus sp. ZRK36]
MSMLSRIKRVSGTLTLWGLCTVSSHAQATIHYLGPSQYESQEDAPAPSHPIIPKVTDSLLGNEGRATLDKAVSGFLEAIAREYPELDITVIDPTSREYRTREMEDAVYATVAFHPADIVVIDNPLTGKTVQYDTYIFLSLYLLRASDGTVLYARTLIINPQFETGIPPGHPEAQARFRDAIIRSFDPTQPRARFHIAAIAEALQRGTFRSPYSTTYGITSDAVDFTGALASGENQVQDPASMQRFFQKYVEAEASDDFLVVASPSVNPTQEQIKDIAVNVYRLQVFTDMLDESGIAEEKSGRYYLPLRLPVPDYQLKLQLSLDVNVLKNARFFKLGDYRYASTLTPLNTSSGTPRPALTDSGTQKFKVAANGKVTPMAIKNLLALIHLQLSGKKN